MSTVEELQTKVNDYYEKINELNEEIQRIEQESNERRLEFVNNKEDIIKKLEKLMGDDSKRPDTVKGLSQYSPDEISTMTDIILTFVIDAQKQQLETVINLVRMI